MRSGAEYVLGAYGVVLFFAVMYAVAVGMRAARLARESELLARLRARRPDHDQKAEPEPEPARERPLEPADR